MKWQATIANSLWIGSSFKEWADFRRALTCPGEVQRNLLRRLVATSSNCAYGRKLRFRNIGTYEEFANRVPIADYEDFSPWIDRIRNGEQHVLTCDAVTHLIPTSGSSGPRKLIPFTAGLQRQLNRAIGPWMIDLARERPGLLFGPAYWSITPDCTQAELDDSAIPIGFVDDAQYLGGARGWLVRAATIAPEPAMDARDMEDFRYRTLCCLVRERELRLISVWHPSFLTLLLDALPEYWERILARISRENARRARELERVVPKNPREIWPQLSVISCWGDGLAERAHADLRRRFPDVLLQAKGLLATEAFVTIPFAGTHPLAVCSHFFEFMDEKGRVHLTEGLHEGETYEVVVTTAGGLWRYRMHDLVRVDGFVGRTPSLKFIGRSGNVSDLFGEKLSEAFASQAIRKSMPGLMDDVPFMLLAPDEDEIGWRYTLYIQGKTPGEIADKLDCALRRNPHYAYCRDLGQLQMPRIFCVTKGGYEAFAHRWVAEGKRLGDIKPTLFSRESGWSKIFAGDYLDSAAAAERRAIPARG